MPEYSGWESIALIPSQRRLFSRKTIGVLTLRIEAISRAEKRRIGNVNRITSL